MSVACMETWYAIKYGPLYELSEQQLVDCDRGWNNGCSGGWPTDAFEFYATNGANLRADYPYTNNDNRGCKQD